MTVRTSTLALASLAAAAVGAASAPAAAQMLLQADFDATFPGGSYGYTYQGAGSSSFVRDVAPVGVGGSDAQRVTADFTNAGGTFSGVGSGVQDFFEGETPSPFTAAPDSPSDISYTFSLAANGLNAGVNSTFSNNEITFTAPDDTLGGDADTNADVLVRFLVEGGVAADGFTTLSGDLGSAPVLAGSFANLQNFFDQVNVVQLNVNFGAGFNDFGQDAGNSIVLDNVLIAGPNPIPEPAALGLVGLAGLGLVRRRRA